MDAISRPAIHGTKLVELGFSDANTEIICKGFLLFHRAF
jgi:hypothetical protein